MKMNKDSRIREMSEKLKLNFAADYVSYISKNDNFTDNLLRLLELEVEEKSNRSIERRIKAAGFPVIYTLDTFKFDSERLPNLNKEQVQRLFDCQFIEEKKNVIAIGNPGTGKTHLLSALGYEAARQGFTVRFKKASDLVSQMSKANHEKKLSEYIKKVNNCHLLICDELGYLNFDINDASLLFQIFADRHELKSTMITTNIEFPRWTEFLGKDKMLSTAIVDRLIHRAELLNMFGTSFRYSEAKEALAALNNGGG